MAETDYSGGESAPEERQDKAARKHVPRRKTAFDWIIAGGSLAGALAAIGVVASFALDRLPFAKAAEVNERVSAVEQDVKLLKGDLGEIRTSGLETLQLQLMDRMQRVDDALARLAPGSTEYIEKRRDRNELQQRLDRLSVDLARSRGPQ
jgi:hypothetical protein